MIYYQKQAGEVEGGLYIKDVGWFLPEEMGVLPTVEKNRQGYLVKCKIQDEFYSEKIYEEETKTPASEECLVDGDKHLGFYCYGVSYIFDKKISRGYSAGTLREEYAGNYKNEDGVSVNKWVSFFFTLSRMQEDLKKNPIIATGRFANYTTIEDLIIPEGVEIIDCQAFAFCRNLKRVVIPRSVKKIKEKAFSHCVDLDEVYILGATELEPLAFKECDHLKVAFGPSAKINYYSFYIYDRYGKIGGSAYWANYGFDHYAVDEIYFIGTQEEYTKYLEGNEQLAEYIKEKKVSFYSETPLEGAWHFVSDIPTEW